VNSIHRNGVSTLKSQYELIDANPKFQRDLVVKENNRKNPGESDDEFNMESLNIDLQSFFAMDERELLDYQEWVDLRITDIEERIFRHIQEKKLTLVNR
jgi:hypothetical protein